MKIESLQQIVPYEITPENAARFAERIVAVTKDQDQIDLDYSIASLKKIDEILEAWMGHKGITPRKVAASLFGYGCYVGEVIVRNNPGAHWIMLADDETESSLNSGLAVLMPLGTQVNPIGKAEKRLINGEGDSLEEFYKFIVRLDNEDA